MYWDEVAIALDAYSFNETGKDMNNMSFLQPVFGSYGDFKAPVFIMIATFFVKLFGMNAFAIRLPIALFSLGTLILSYFLVKEILSFDKKLGKKYELFTKFDLFNFSHLSLASSFCQNWFGIKLICFLFASCFVTVFERNKREIN